MKRRTGAGKSGGAVALATALLLLAASEAAVAGNTLRWASDRDVRSLDPYAGGDVLLRSFDANIYEPLVRRGRDLALEPALATRWRQTAPDRWRFALRPGVRFQDGTPFSAADVLFSFARARAPASKAVRLLAQVQELRALDPLTVEFVTDGPDPLLPDRLVAWGIMSRAWCEAHDAAAPADLAREATGYAGDHANGTGPFMLAERLAGERTVLVPNPGWWDRRADNLDRVEFTPLEAAQLVPQIAAGALDVITAVPPDEIDRVARLPGVRLVEGPSLVTVFLGFDVARATPWDGGAAVNPFKDRRVREAVAHAVDETAIVATVMHGDATPAGLMVGPGVEGYDAAQDGRWSYDPALARRLLAQAGYAHGFATGMDCPTDRYVNDAAICAAVVAMLAPVGIAVTLYTETRAAFFEKILPPVRHSSFFLMGWAPTSEDAGTLLADLAATADPAAHLGDFNAAGYANPALDALLQRIAVASDPAQRRALLGQGLTMLKSDLAYLPLHRQNQVWAKRSGVALVQRADGSFPLRYVQMK